MTRAEGWHVAGMLSRVQEDGEEDGLQEATRHSPRPREDRDCTAGTVETARVYKEVPLEAGPYYSIFTKVYQSCKSIIRRYKTHIP